MRQTAGGGSPHAEPAPDSRDQPTTVSASWLSTPAAGLRLLTRKSTNFSNRFPQVVAAVISLPVRSCLIDGEAVVCDENGLAVFDLIRGCRHDAAAVLCAFDLLELDGEEERKGIRPSSWATPMWASPSTSNYDDDGPIIYKHACALGCEGIVSKRLGSPYRSGRVDCWVKIKPGGTGGAARGGRGLGLEAVWR
jgi:bifunctional non-homologous end joining protein LigD